MLDGSIRLWNASPSFIICAQGKNRIWRSDGISISRVTPGASRRRPWQTLRLQHACKKNETVLNRSHQFSDPGPPGLLLTARSRLSPDRVIRLHIPACPMFK